MIQFFGQMLKLPLEAFVFSMEMLVKTIQGIQKIAYKGIDSMVIEVIQPSGDSSGSEGGPTSGLPDGTITDGVETTQKIIQPEGGKMAERDLHDDMLKLVRYKILFVKRDYEYAFPEKEELVSENTDASGYTAWKIAEFIQNLSKTPIPEKWRNKKYPPLEADSPPRDPGMIHALPEDDKKYLRVYYEVLERYPRERFKYEERQIEVLEQIRDRMKDP
jgi:hypothetical protein